MPASALRPRSVTEIVDAAFQIFRAHAGPLVMCSAVAFVPTLVLRLLLVRELAQMGSADPARVLQIAAQSLLSGLASVVAYALMTAMLTVCASQAYLGEEVDVAIALRRVIARFPGVVVVTLVVTVLTFLAFLCLFVPALWVTARYFAVVPVMLLEHRGPFASMARSAELSRGRKWHILNTLGLVLLIYLLLFLGLTLVTAATGNLVVQLVVPAIVTVCIYPVIAITGVLLYYDARIQSEGLDIELMAEALGPATATLAP